MQWASTLSTADGFATALEETCAEIDEQLGSSRPDLVAVFASPHHRANYVRVHRGLRERFPGARLIGASAGGVIATGKEVEGSAGLVVTAAVLPGVDVHTFHIEANQLPTDERTPEDWADPIDVDTGETPHFLVVPDPFSCDANALVSAFDERFPDSIKIGGLASGATAPGQIMLFADDSLHPTGTVGVALKGNIEVDAVVAQGCRPVGSPMFVTRADGNIIYEIDGRLPASIVQELYEQLPPADRKRMSVSLFMGLVMDPDLEVYTQGDFLIRNIVGVDTRSGAMAISANVSANQVVQFHLRDADTSAEDLAGLLHRYMADRKTAPAGALLFSCLGRGTGLYGEPNHDSRLFQQIVGASPIGGFFCNGEIGPVQGRTHLHGYTSSFALFRTRQPQ